MTPEEKARQEIDAQLGSVGLVSTKLQELNLGAAPGITVREVPLKSGSCDYLLIVNRIPVGVIEAKKKGTTLSAVADQSGRYAVGEQMRIVAEVERRLSVIELESPLQVLRFVRVR